MPGRNVTKTYTEDSFYHIYNRGINKSAIFCDLDDYRYFEWLMARTLSGKPAKDNKGRDYAWLRPTIELNAYCLMPNHFHLFVHQVTVSGITKLMLSLATAYTLYFNKKYKRRGPLFEESYRAVLVEHETQLLHITRYIHLNHKHFRTWPHSSLLDYISENGREWIAPEKIIALFPSAAEYHDFVLDYEDAQRSLDNIKISLADNC